MSCLLKHGTYSLREVNRQIGMGPSCICIIYLFFFHVGTHTILNSSQTIASLGVVFCLMSDICV